jgi:hypothetical protein
MSPRLSGLIADATRQAQLLRDLHQSTEADGGSLYHLTVAVTLERLLQEVERLAAVLPRDQVKLRNAG